MNLRPEQLTKYYSGYRIGENEMGGAGSTYGVRRGAYRIGRLILKCIFKKWMGAMSWIDLAQFRYGWRAIVNAIMNLRVPYNVRNFLTT